MISNLYLNKINQSTGSNNVIKRTVGWIITIKHHQSDLYQSKPSHNLIKTNTLAPCDYNMNTTLTYVNELRKCHYRMSTADSGYSHLSFIKCLIRDMALSSIFLRNVFSLSLLFSSILPQRRSTHADKKTPFNEDAMIRFLFGVP